MLLGAAWVFALGTMVISMLAIFVALVGAASVVKHLVKFGFRERFAVRLSLLTAVFGISTGVIFQYSSDKWFVVSSLVL